MIHCITSRLPAALSTLALVAAGGAFAGPANVVCPDYFFLSDNTAVNADFEIPTPGTEPGAKVCWQQGDPSPLASAADKWLMHSSNAGAKVCSSLVASNAPGHAPGSRMLRFQAGGNEGGVYQATGALPGHAYMFSAWVKVMKGQVALQPNGGNTGPASWSSKIGEWEQLRACTNSTGNADMLVIYNEDANGGLFFVDRVEFKELPLRE